MESVSHYFDANASLPLSAAAREAWIETNQRCWANPSAAYRLSAAARNCLDDCRTQWAAWFQCNEERVVFTSGATESANGVMRGLISRARASQPIGVFSAEHAAVRECAAAADPSLIHWLPCQQNGGIDIDFVADWLARTRPLALVVMAANNESGVVQPWRTLAALCTGHDVRFVCDAVQWLGKQPLAGLADCDWVFGSGHKFGGPKGVGVMLRPTAGPDCRLLQGGPQEHGLRAGTENVAGIAAMTAAYAALANNGGWGGCDSAPLVASLDAVWGDRWQPIAAGGDVLGNTLLAAMPQHAAPRWIARLDRHGFSVGSGAACSSGRGGLSPVLQAMGIAPEVARRTLRFSAPPRTTAETWQALGAALIAVGEELDAEASACA
jgi:cysteine desulfurase